MLCQQPVLSQHGTFASSTTRNLYKFLVFKIRFDSSLHGTFTSSCSRGTFTSSATSLSQETFATSASSLSRGTFASSTTRETLQVPLHGTFTSSWPSRYVPLHKMKGDINGVSWTRERARTRHSRTQWRALTHAFTHAQKHALDRTRTHHTRTQGWWGGQWLSFGLKALLPEKVA